MGALSFFPRLFKFKPGWNGTPEMFLAMVMQSRNNKEFVVHEVLQWEEVMQKVVKADPASYRNFADLMQNGVPDFSMVKKLREKMDEIPHRVELKKANRRDFIHDKNGS